MIVEVITLFPNQFEPFLATALLKRAADKGKLELRLHNPRDEAQDAHHTVDDAPFGGGGGMVMMVEPLMRTWRRITRDAPETYRTVVLSASGRLLDHSAAVEMSLRDRLILVCGHYKGIDERFLALTGAEEWSIGDYVLSGGELPALVLLDAVVRLLPGVMNDFSSAMGDAFFDGLLGAPVYTRPRVFEDVAVPEVLFGGNPKEIDTFRREAARRKTESHRPDLWHKWLAEHPPDEESAPSRSRKPKKG